MESIVQDYKLANTGIIISNRFKLIKQIGQGSFCTIFSGINIHYFKDYPQLQIVY